MEREGVESNAAVVTYFSNTLYVSTYAHSAARRKARRLAAAYSSGRITFRRRRNERRRHEQSIRMITSVTLRDMKRNGRRGPWGVKEPGVKRKREHRSEAASAGGRRGRATGCPGVMNANVLKSKSLFCLDASYALLHAPPGLRRGHAGAAGTD